MTLTSTRPDPTVSRPAPRPIPARLARSAIAAIARREVRRGWAGLVVLGLLAGIAGAVATAALVVERRTASAEARLRVAMGVEDVRITSLGGTVPSTAGIAGVAREWRPSVVVGQLTGAAQLSYLAVLAGPDHPGIFNPVVVQGRSPRADSLDEVQVAETAAASIGLKIGSTFSLHLLSAAQAADWSTGIGEPKGPELTFRVVGLTRLTPKATNGVGIMASRRFHQVYGQQLTQGGLVMIQAKDGVQPETIARDLERRAPAGSGFQVDYSSRETAPVRTSAQILSGGALSFVAVAGLAGLIALVQFSSRHHTGSTHAQEVEHALGLTGTERVLGHALPSLLSASIAAVITAGGGIAGGFAEPLGALRSSEPAPGFRLDVATTLAGAVLVALLVLGASAATAARVLAPPALTGRPRRPSRLFGGPVPTAAFRLVSGRRGSLRLTAAVSGIVLATTGMLAAISVHDSLQNLIVSPADYGQIADVSVADSRPELIDQWQRDDRVGSMALQLIGRATVDGRAVTSYADRPIAGQLTWAMLDGRPPDVDDEIVLGARLARAIGAWTGDTVTLDTRHGPQPYRVTGVGIGPYDGESFGTNALFTPGGLGLSTLTPAYSNLIADLRPGTSRDAFVRDYAQTWEINVSSPPIEVSSLAGLGRLPVYLALFFAAAGVAALAHSAFSMLRRSRRDLAILHTIGFTQAQVGAVVLTATTIIGMAGVLIGVPLGLAAGRLVWTLVTSGIGIVPDVQVPAGFALLTIPAGLVIALLAGAAPSWRASRTPHHQALSRE